MFNEIEFFERVRESVDRRSVAVERTLRRRERECRDTGSCLHAHQMEAWNWRNLKTQAQAQEQEYKKTKMQEYKKTRKQEHKNTRTRSCFGCSHICAVFLRVHSCSVLKQATVKCRFKPRTILETEMQFLRGDVCLGMIRLRGLWYRVHGEKTQNPNQEAKSATKPDADDASLIGIVFLLCIDPTW